MTARVVLRTASRSRWLARRRKGITATDVPAILGLHPYKTPLGVWLDKTRPGGDQSAGYAARRGTHMEDFLASEYARATGAVVERPPLLLAHPTRPLFIASVDRLAHTPDATRVLEIKTSSRWEDWADYGCPDHYAVQALHQLAVTGLDEAVIFADVNGRIEQRTIHADRGWEDRALPMLEQWWADHVAADIPPPIEPRDWPDLNRVWAPQPGVEVEADQATAGAVHAHATLTARRKALGDITDRLRVQIRSHMKDATVLTVDGQKAARIDRRGALTVTYTPPTTESGEA